MFDWLFTTEHINITIELDGIKQNNNINKGKQNVIDYDEEVINYPSFDIDGKVTGRISINILNGQKIHHNGLKVSLEQYVAFLYPKLTADLYKIELLLSKEGILEGNNIIPFEIPLIERDDDKKSNITTSNDIAISLSRISCTKDNGLISSRAESCLFDSYEGVAFSLRHIIIVQIMRPWYSRSCLVHKDLRLFRVNIPDETALREEITMQIRDCGGRCTVYVPSKWVDIVTSPKISFTVAVRDLKRPIVAMYVFLIRAEFIEDEHLDEVILLHKVFGEKIQKVIDAVPDRACYSEGFESRADDTDDDPRPDDPIMRSANLAFNIFLTSKSIFPSTRNSDYDDISEQIPNQKYMGDFKREVVTRRTSAIVKENRREVKPILLLSPSFDTCSVGLDYIRMENEEDPEAQEKLQEVRSADWTEQLKVPNNDTSNNNDDNNENIKIKQKIITKYDDDDNEMLKDSISLRYFIRVLVQDAAGRSCWDTTEIKLYRGGRYVSPVPVAAAIPDV